MQFAYTRQGQNKEGIIMKKITKIMTISVSVFALMVFLTCSSFAEQKTFTIPKGSKIEKLEEGHFKFILPNKQIVELKEFNPKTGTAGFVQIIDPMPPSKPIAGKKATLKMRKLSREKAAKLTKPDYVQIDDDVTWLPITMTYQLTGLVDPNKPKALSPQPDPPGKR
jgi:hypothetical protein